MEKLKFAVVGGDRRAAYAAQGLIAKRYEVSVAALELSGLIDPPRLAGVGEALRDADVVLLPMPLVGADGRVFGEYSCDRPDPREVISKAKSGALLFAGRVSGEIAEYARRCGRELCDYLSREELQLKNAVPTAEGTIEILMRRLPVTLAGAQIAVIGYGRTAQSLCDALLGLGASVTVWARKPAALALAGTRGCAALPLSDFSERRRRYEAVVNTVPAPVLAEAELRRLPRGCLVLDIASERCIADEKAVSALGIEYERALSLPGKAAPKTAGRIIVETVFEILRERGVCI